jgi:hypothetical protein
MKTILIEKKDKKIKLILKKDKLKNTIIVNGPLGSLNYEFSSTEKHFGNKIFVKSNNINFLVKKLKKLIKSVTNG